MEGKYASDITPSVPTFANSAPLPITPKSLLMRDHYFQTTELETDGRAPLHGQSWRSFLLATLAIVSLANPVHREKCIPPRQSLTTSTDPENRVPDHDLVCGAQPVRFHRSTVDNEAIRAVEIVETPAMLIP